MALGRTSRFVKLPPGARRVSVMRLGTAGIKALAPAMDLLLDFKKAKSALVKGGMKADAAHAEAFRRVDYRDRFLRQIRSDPAALRALRDVIARAKTEDLFLMCMCPPHTRDRACHTYLLLELARETEAGVAFLEEPG
jgi:hypothetical protein